MNSFESSRYAAELETAVSAAQAAAGVIRDYYHRSTARTYEKADGSPVTDADLAADRLIRAAISERFPADAFLTEEGADDPARLDASRCWIVDPIDGTAQFIAGTGRFDCMIALVVDARPVVAVIGHPVSGSFLGAVAGCGAFCETNGERERAAFTQMNPKIPVRIASSIWLGMPALAGEMERIAAEAGGVIAPTIDVGNRPIEYLAPDRTYDALVGPIAHAETTYGGEWDFAAADLIVHEAGGVMSDLLGRPHQYNKPAIRNRGGLIVSCDPSTHARIVAAVAAGLPPELAAETERDAVTAKR